MQEEVEEEEQEKERREWNALHVVCFLCHLANSTHTHVYEESFAMERVKLTNESENELKKSDNQSYGWENCSRLVVQ